MQSSSHFIIQISEAVAIRSHSPEVPSAEHVMVYCLSSRKFLYIITLFPDDVSGFFFEVTDDYSFQAAENFSTFSYLSTVCNFFSQDGLVKYSSDKNVQCKQRIHKEICK